MWISFRIEILEPILKTKGFEYDGECLFENKLKKRVINDSDDLLNEILINDE